MRRIPLLAGAFTLLAATGAEALDLRASLRGSRAAMERQHRVALEHGLTFYRTGAQIVRAAERGDLVELRGNEDYDVADFVVYPYARPALRTFVERLAAQYREACGQKLVVTSLTRPTSEQPRNAHALSVHPAGMAVDLRVSDRASCRAWLEDTLLVLERRGLLDGIREFHPPHYHVAVFPDPYTAYVEQRLAAEAEREAAARAAEARAAVRIARVDGDADADDVVRVSSSGDDVRDDARSHRGGVLGAVSAVASFLGELLSSIFRA